MMREEQREKGIKTAEELNRILESQRQEATWS